MAKKVVLTARERAFRSTVWRHYRARGRLALPWRKTSDPYRILVSEIMLQQTQVDRVLPFYSAFMKKFPTARALSRAPLSEVLRAWQGLGYNRRAVMLQLAGKELTLRTPHSVAEWEALPGVGPYTARAVSVFAENANEIVIETNIRTAVIHHFFADRKNVRDEAIARVLARVLPRGRAREWYSALMDYGSALKRAGAKHHRNSAGYKKQPRFAGSLREVRGMLVRTLATRKLSLAEARTLVDATRHEQLQQALDALQKEGMIVFRRARYELATEGSAQRASRYRPRTPKYSR